MGKNSKNDAAEQGSDAFNKAISESQFQEYVKKDLRVACSLLNALAQDENTLNYLGSFLYGQYQNRIHKEELQRQTQIEA